MKTSSKGLNLIKSFEGCHLTSYKCPSGVWTIGYGHTAGVTEGNHISQEQAEQYLADDLVRFEKYVETYAKKYGYKLNQDQFDALVSFTYNAGPGNLEKHLFQKSYRPLELIKLYLPTTCIKSKGKVLSGLVRRRVSEADLMGDCRKNVCLVAEEVKRGLWGSGAARKRQLEECGYNYREIQDEVNKLML